MPTWQQGLEMSKMADVNVESTAPLLAGVEDVKRALSEAEAKILHMAKDQMLKDIKPGWTGWLYREPKPHGRPMDRRNISQAAWTATVTTQSAAEASIQLVNEARHSWAKTPRPYVGYVKRSGSSVLEINKVLDMLHTVHLPALLDDLTEAIKDSIKEGPAKQIRRDHGVDFHSITLTG